MHKLTVKYADGVIQSFISDDFCVIIRIMETLKENCKNNNQPAPEFDFDGWVIH